MRIPDDIYLKLAEEYEKLSWSISQLLRVILTNEFSFSVEQKVESEIDKETEHKLLNDKSHEGFFLSCLRGSKQNYQVHNSGKQFSKLPTRQ